MPPAPTQPTVTDIPFLEEMLEAAMLRAFGGYDPEGNKQDAEKGVAGVQAQKLVLQIKAQLDTARAAAVRDGTDGDLDHLTEGELVERMELAADGMPLPHLEVYVTAYCRRVGAHLVTDG